MELIPAAAISGRVTGPDGAAMVGQDVRAFRAHRQGDETRLAGVWVTTSDDLGRYRLHTLPPGEYFIASGLGLPEFGDDAQAARKPMVPGTDVPLLTFYPSTTEPEASPPLVLNGGEDVENKDIRVRRAPVIRISGYVLNHSSVKGASSASIQLFRGDKTWIISHGGVLGSSESLAGTRADFTESDQGRWDIRGAFPPGAYELRAVIEAFDRVSRVTRKAIGATRVDIGYHDLEGVVVTVENVAQ
jgi:hypothetical protein